MDEIERRLEALESVVARLQEGSGRPADAPPPEGRFWILDGLKQQLPEGAVGFAGHLETPAGRAEWQWGRTAADLLAAEWEDSAPALAALGHPVRLRLLQRVLAGVTTTADLAQDEELGTTGQLHHHLRALVSAGWLTSTGRGRYVVSPARVIPLLVIVSATLPS